MAAVAEENQAACSNLLVAASHCLGAATILKEREKQKNSTWVKPYIREQTK